MANTTIKEVTNPVAGLDSDHSGGTDWNQFAQVLKGTHATERIQSSSIQKTTITVTGANVSITDAQERILADCTSNAITITLPDATTLLNGHIMIKKIDSTIANLVTIQGTSSQTIDGCLTYILRDRNSSVELQSDGANWKINQASEIPIQNLRAKGATLGRWYSNEVLANTAPIACSPVAGIMYALPLIITKTVTIDSVAINVTTLGAASHVEAGIYYDNGNMYLGALLVDFGNVDTSGIGVKTFASGLPITLLPGFYWPTFLCSATAPQVSGWAATQLPPILGTTSVLTAACGLGWSVSQAYGALPGTYPAGGAVLTAAPLPGIFWRTSG